MFKIKLIKINDARWNIKSMCHEYYINMVFRHNCIIAIIHDRGNNRKDRFVIYG